MSMNNAELRQFLTTLDDTAESLRTLANKNVDVSYPYMLVTTMAEEVRSKLEPATWVD